jgi:alcohol-forming fatty acyl-CoA reductase
MALYDSLSEADRAVFAFDTSVIDWPHYFIDVHCPAVTAPVRRLDELRALRKKPAAGELRGVGAGGTGICAFFDMDGTLLSSNVIETYLWVRLRELDGGQRLAELGRIASKVPSLVQAERRQRSDFLRAVYREYDGARLADLDAIVDEHLTDHILSRLSPDAVRRIREHRAAGHQTVLITGAIRPLTRPLLPLFDHIEAADLAVDDRGVCTGHLASSPLVGESRGAWMQSYATEHGIDMKASFAYADSHSDLPLLEAVGNPVAVRPDVSLYKHARRAHWDIADWASPSGATRALDPAGRVLS